MYYITVYASRGELNAGKFIILLYMLRVESEMQVNVLYYCICLDGRVKCR